MHEHDQDNLNVSRPSRGSEYETMARPPSVETLGYFRRPLLGPI